MATLFPDLDSKLADNRRRRSKQREYYAENRERIIAQTAAAAKKRSKQLRKIVDDFKRQPCASCGGDFPAVAMQCHHRDPATKAADIAKLVHKGVREETLRMELAKCDVLCANCHMILHHGKED